MIVEDAPPMTKIHADPAVDGRSLQQSESQEFARGYKSCALDVYMVATGNTGALDIDDDRFKFVKSLLDQIETWRNKQRMMATKTN